MGGEADLRCDLPIARELRLNADLGGFSLEQDICDVTLWLVQKYRLRSVLVWIGRHYTHRCREIAGVTVMMSPRHPDRLTPAARETFLALGYGIEHTGADTHGHQF